MRPDDEGRAQGPPFDENVVTQPLDTTADKLQRRLHSTTGRRQCGDDTLAALHRRRQASRRMVPLACGCADPWPCRCTDPPLSERAIENWRDTALHVLSTGYLPVLPIEARRALWRRGGADRVLAELLHDACGGEAA
jgi:hypothetical protein